ncbi:hypothetical protein BY996DRAFT_6426483 [Phakopsora pachyrhizi]|nr:hypothetical protein BY996DRAFT_6426483 [Phakopsora pachyrhizi]
MAMSPNAYQVQGEGTSFDGFLLLAYKHGFGSGNSCGDQCETKTRDSHQQVKGHGSTLSGYHNLRTRLGVEFQHVRYCHRKTCVPEIAADFRIDGAEALLRFSPILHRPLRAPYYSTGVTQAKIQTTIGLHANLVVKLMGSCRMCLPGCSESGTWRKEFLTRKAELPLAYEKSHIG